MGKKEGKWKGETKKKGKGGKMGGRGGGKEKRRKDELSIEKYREFSMFYDKNYILIFFKKKNSHFLNW